MTRLLPTAFSSPLLCQKCNSNNAYVSSIQLSARMWCFGGSIWKNSTNDGGRKTDEFFQPITQTKPLLLLYVTSRLESLRSVGTHEASRYFTRTPKTWTPLLSGVKPKTLQNIEWKIMTLWLRSVVFKGHPGYILGFIMTHVHIGNPGIYPGCPPDDHSAKRVVTLHGRLKNRRPFWAG